MSDGKILYFVRPEETRQRVENDFPRAQDHLRKIDEDAIARRHFYDLLRGVWPASPHSLS